MLLDAMMNDIKSEIFWKPPYRLSVSLFILSCGLYELTNTNAALEASEYIAAVYSYRTYIIAHSHYTCIKASSSER